MDRRDWNSTRGCRRRAKTEWQWFTPGRQPAATSGYRRALVVFLPLMFGALGATHRFESGERRIGFRKRIQIRRDLRDRRCDVVDVGILADQEKLRQPHGLVICGSLGNGAVYG